MAKPLAGEWPVATHVQLATFPKAQLPIVEALRGATEREANWYWAAPRGASSRPIAPTRFPLLAPTSASHLGLRPRASVSQSAKPHPSLPDRDGTATQTSTPSSTLAAPIAPPSQKSLTWSVK